MRVIQFRGKRVDNGEWIYGDLVRDLYCVPTSIFSDGKFYPVVTESVGQFTGLTDKNGKKKIFEGDKLNCIDRILEVYFNEICGCWDCKFIEYVKGGVTCYLRIDSVGWDKFEVIGNIHENPELLEESE